MAIAERAASMVGGLLHSAHKANETDKRFLETEIDHVGGNLHRSGNRVGLRRGPT
jgi:hypothetical protein